LALKAPENQFAHPIFLAHESQSPEFAERLHHQVAEGEGIG